MKNLSLRSLIKSGLALAFLAVFFTACQKMDVRPPGNTDKRTIAQLVSQTPGFELLKAAIARAGLQDDLNKPGNLTVFAPTNDAFIAAGFKNTADIAKADKEVLKSILLFHVLDKRVPASAIPEANNTPVTALSGGTLYATRKGSNVSINGVTVIRADINAANGVIHVINRVLLPPAGNLVVVAQSNPAFSFLVAAVVRAGLASALQGDGPLTVFAPTNQAFIDAGFKDINSIQQADPAALTPILLYHVVAGRVFSSQLSNGPVPTLLIPQTVGISLAGPTVKGNRNATPSNIIITDVVATNGVVHAIDQVLLPNP
jgi:uncharacterized surface protein with fasciclin (FAS1) repeats